MDDDAKKLSQKIRARMEGGFASRQAAYDEYLRNQSEEPMTNEQFNQIKSFIRDELDVLKSDIRTRIDALSQAIETRGTGRGASKDKKDDLTKEQKGIVLDVASDWYQSHGADKPLTASMFKGLIYSKSTDFGMTLETKGVWTKVCSWMLEANIFRKVQQGKTPATTVYFVGAAVTDDDEVQGIGSRPNGQQETVN